MKFPGPWAKRWFGDDSASSQALRIEQVLVLSRGTPSMALGQLFNSALTAGVLSGTVAPWVLLVWLGMVWVPASHGLLSWWRARGRARPARVRTRTLVRATLWSGLAGLMWGLAGALLPALQAEPQIEHHVFLAFVIGGQAAIAAAWLAPLLPAYLAFLGASTVPLMVGLAFGGHALGLTMAAMVAVGSAALVAFARHGSRSFRERIESGEERERLLAALQTSRDEMERQVAERTEELAASQGRLQGLFDTVPGWLFVKDEDLRYVMVNRPMAAFFGRTPEQIAGHTYAEIVGPDGPGAKESDRLDLEVLRNDRSAEQEALEVLMPDGTVTVRHVIEAPLHDEHGCVAGIVGTSIDITQRVRLEQQFRQAQKMDAVGQLAGGVAHEFNNALQVIRGYGQIALSSLHDPECVRDSLRRVLNSTQSAAEITQRLLNYSRQDLPSKGSVEVNAALSELVAMAGRLLGERIELSYEPEHLPARAEVDAGLLTQALLNLCVNARDAMPAGGRVALSAQVLTRELPFTTYAGRAAPGRYIALSVEDTGVGMSATVRDRMFEPFFTTKGVGQGTGLGLAVVYRFVEHSNGYVDVDSRPGRGTRVTLYLPASDAELPAAEIEARPPPPATGPGACILVAEDEEAVRGLLERVLQGAGYTVLGARDGEEALRLFERNGARIDLAVLDVVMPKRGGREVYEAIHARRPDLPVLFSTGYSEDQIDPEFLDRSGISVLRKPYSPDDLLAKVRERLEALQAGAVDCRARPASS